MANLGQARASGGDSSKDSGGEKVSGTVMYRHPLAHAQDKAMYYRDKNGVYHDLDDIARQDHNRDAGTMAYPQTTFDQCHVHDGGLLGRRRKAVSRNTLLYQLQVLKDTGRYDAFKLGWHSSYSDPPDVPPVPNHLFWDSDIGKWIEGACYFLHDTHSPEVETAVHELVDMIASAQQSDGYLNIHYTVVEPGLRFTNLRDMHELYNAGHLIEAALAHNALFKNEKLLAPMQKYADLLCKLFGPDDTQLHGYPGHPEIELALIRLYDRTDVRKYLELARYFLAERGNPTGCQGRHFYDVELERRGADVMKRPLPWPDNRSLWYQQAHLPIEEQNTIEGHSVRAMYLLTAVADLVRLDESHKIADTSQLKVAMYRLWDNMINRKMYVTGGIGAIKAWEGFGPDYFLPQGTDDGGCYAETCASIGVMMLAERLLKLGITHDCLDGKYGDILELCLYNSVLTAMSHDGKKFTYVNQLASSDTDLSQRESWFTCSCCPPNVLRLFGQLGGYIYNERRTTDDTLTELIVHLYVSSTYTLKTTDSEITVTQESDYPWSGDIKFTVKGSPLGLCLKLRIPAWAKSWKLEPPNLYDPVKEGYLFLYPRWLAQNPTFTLSLPLQPRWVTQGTNATTSGLLTLARGPIVYCVEDVDNSWVNDHFKTTFVDPKAHLQERVIENEDLTGDSFVALDLLSGATTLDGREDTPLSVGPSVDAVALQDSISRSQPLDALRFVPYYFRANRKGKGHMRVGLRQWHR